LNSEWSLVRWDREKGNFRKILSVEGILPRHDWIKGIKNLLQGGPHGDYIRWGRQEQSREHHERAKM